MELGRALHAEFEHPFPLDERKAAFVTAVAIQNALAIGIENKKGELVGAFLMRPDTVWFSSTPALFEIGFFVRKDSRRSHAARLLIDAAKAIADDMGLPLFPTPFTGVDMDRKDKLFERTGFRRVGSIYRWG